MILFPRNHPRMGATTTIPTQMPWCFVHRINRIHIMILLLLLLLSSVACHHSSGVSTTTVMTATQHPPHPNPYSKRDTDRTTRTPPTNTIQTTKKTSEDYRVHDLEQIEPSFQYYNGTMYAGLISTTPAYYDDHHNDPTNDDHGALMFWLYEPTHPTYTDTLVLWFNGGPGCSSFGGMLFENGPVTIPRYPAGYYGIDPNVSLSYNPYSWTRTTSIMYIEQPQGGTGFSQDGTVPHNEREISRNMYHFLQNFYTIFDTNDRHSVNPKWRNKKLFLFGESYAGMYVPSMAHYIYQQNVKIEQEEEQDHSSMKQQHEQHIPLAGIALGNGWMDVLVQGPAVIDYAWWHGMIDSSTKQALHNEWKNCRPEKNDATTSTTNHPPTKFSKDSPFHTFTVPDECGIMSAVLQAAGMNVVDWGTPNAYDVTTWDPYLMLDVPFGSIHQFFNDPRVQKALHVVPARPWVECIPGAGRRRKLQSGQRRQLTKLRLPGELLLDHDEPISVVPYVADLLDKANIRVLVYNGDRDMTTNSQGSEMLLDSMVWDGAAGWADVKEFERGVWLPQVGMQLGGYIKQYQNLEFLVVYNSGHLVPFNQDEIALELVTRFLGNVSFLDKPLPKFHIHRTHPTDAATDKSMQIDQINPYRPRYHFIRDVVGASIFMLLGSVIGFIWSRRSTKGRNLYQVIPNN